MFGNSAVSNFNQNEADDWWDDGMMPSMLRVQLRHFFVAAVLAAASVQGTNAGPLGDTLNRVGDRLNNTTERLGNTVDRVGQGVGGTLGGLGQGLGTTIDRVGDPIGGPVDSLTNTLGSTVEGVTGTLGTTVEGVTGTLGNTVQGVGGVVQAVTGGIAGTLGETVDYVKPDSLVDTAGRPINPSAFEQDDHGHRVVRGVVLAVELSDKGRDAADDAGFDIEADEQFAPLGLKATRLTPPDGMSAVAALKVLRDADPHGRYDYLHIYDPTGGPAKAAKASAALLSPVRRGDVKIGMIDAGIDQLHPAFRSAEISATNTAGKSRSPRPTAHGTAVASLLIGDDSGFSGALPGATLYAADAFAGSETGGAADDIARAISWMVEKNVPVINISIAGPKNALLEAAVRAAIQRGHVIVAAVGNDGPSVDVKFPAAYDGVVAVTSVDERKRVQIDANRGPAVAFAARGVDVRVADVSGGYGVATGTSYASPIVAARFAELLGKPDVTLAASARAQLQTTARSPSGKVGPVYGWGILDSRASTREASR